MSVDQGTGADSPPATLQARAQVEAERHFGGGRVAEWRPAGTGGAPGPLLRRALSFASASGLSVAVIVAGARWASAGNAPQATSVAITPAIEQESATKVAAPARPAAVISPQPAAATLNITRQGAEWRIEAAGVSRLAIAQRWAQASGSPVIGDLAQLASTRPLHLRWRGDDVADAWRAVLGSDLSFAMQCSATHCRVWVLEGGTSEPTAGPRPRPTPTASAAPLEVAAGGSASESTDPRVAAFHD